MEKERIERIAKLRRRYLLARRHGGVKSLQYTAGENLALQFRGGDTLRGNKRALDISRHHCISRNLLLFASRQDDGQKCFSAARRTEGRNIFFKEWTVERQSGAAARSQCFLNNVKHVLLCISHASAGEVKERRGEGRRGEGGQQQQQEEELEGFDAMQTGSTKARRQKFSIHHKNKSACVPALVQSDCKEGQSVTKPVKHRVTWLLIYHLESYH